MGEECSRPTDSDSRFEPRAAKMTPQPSVVKGVAFLLLLSAIASFALASVATAQGSSPFTKLAGTWLGEGRRGYAAGKVERVKCRVSYIGSERQLRQTSAWATE